MAESASIDAPSTSVFSSSGSSSTTNARGSDAQPCGTVGLLERLRAPHPLELSCKWKGHANPPVGKKRSKQRTHNFDPTSITLSQRASEYPKEHLVESNQKLFCKILQGNSGSTVQCSA